MSKYEVFPGTYLSVFGPEKTPYLDTFHVVIPPSILNSSSEATAVLYRLFSEAIIKRRFTGKLKLADFTPGDSFNKSTYRPVSILPIISKIYKKLMENKYINKRSFVSLLVWV